MSMLSRLFSIVAIFPFAGFILYGLVLCAPVLAEEVGGIEEVVPEESFVEENLAEELPAEEAPDEEIPEEKALGEEPPAEEEAVISETPPTPPRLEMLSLKMIRRNELGLPGIKIQLSEQSAFTFSRVGRTLYQLTLKECAVAGEHLLLVQFPPEELKGVQLVQANKRGDDIVINIVVEEQARLEAIPIGNAVWVEVRG